MYRIHNIVARLLNPWVTIKVSTQESPGVYLTFDDGPNPQSTDILLQHLYSHKVSATFFLLGQNASDHPDLVTKIREQGHAVCSHGWVHQRYQCCQKSKNHQQLYDSLELLKTQYYRPPYGKIGILRLLRLRKRGVKTILWNVDPADYAVNLPSDRKLLRLISRIRAGDIILLHDKPRNIQFTLKCIDHIISELRSKGINFSIFS